MSLLNFLSRAHLWASECDCSNASHNSCRNPSYVLRNFSRYRRSRVSVVSWIVVSSLTRFATGVTLGTIVLWGHIGLWIVNSGPRIHSVDRTGTERHRGRGRSGRFLQEFRLDFSSLHVVQERGLDRRASGSDRASTQACPDHDRPLRS